MGFGFIFCLYSSWTREMCYSSANFCFSSLLRGISAVVKSLTALEIFERSSVPDWFSYKQGVRLLSALAFEQHQTRWGSRQEDIDVFYFIFFRGHCLNLASRPLLVSRYCLRKDLAAHCRQVQELGDGP